MLIINAKYVVITKIIFGSLHCGNSSYKNQHPSRISNTVLCSKSRYCTRWRKKTGNHTFTMERVGFVFSVLYRGQYFYCIFLHTCIWETSRCLIKNKTFLPLASIRVHPWLVMWYMLLLCFYVRFFHLRSYSVYVAQWSLFL